MNKERIAKLKEALREAATEHNKVHIISREGKWAVVKEGAKRATAIHDTRKEAVTHGKKVFKNGSFDYLVLHKTDGSVDKFLLEK